MITIRKWSSLTVKEQNQILARPSKLVSASVRQQTKKILADVKNQGELAVRRYTKQFDGVEIDNFLVSKVERIAAKNQISKENRKAIEFAYSQICQFHEHQFENILAGSSKSQLGCNTLYRALNNVGLYVPGGKAPLPSTLLMLAIPAMIAGCNRKIVCTPPRYDGSIDKHILFAADLCEINEIYKIGGVQAVGAMAYGLNSIEPVDKIFGPGNAWVTAAKSQVMQEDKGTACDLPAGPSELLIIADETANPEFIAADLLSQAEHSTDAQVLLLTTCAKLAARVQSEIRLQIGRLSRKQSIAVALKTANIILVPNINTALEINNRYAPEHLSLQIQQPDDWLDSVENAGAIFLGSLTAQTLGDYVLGSNHVLPTGGSSKVYSGLGVIDFLKAIHVQHVDLMSLRKMAPYAVTLAQLESLDAHKNAIEIRLRELSCL